VVVRWVAPWLDATPPRAVYSLNDLLASGTAKRTRLKLMSVGFLCLETGVVTFDGLEGKSSKELSVQNGRSDINGTSQTCR